MASWVASLIVLTDSPNFAIKIRLEMGQVWPNLENTNNWYRYRYIGIFRKLVSVLERYSYLKIGNKFAKSLLCKNQLWLRLSMGCDWVKVVTSNQWGLTPEQLILFLFLKDKLFASPRHPVVCFNIRGPFLSNKKVCLSGRWSIVWIYFYDSL